jgi:hypothetical protein
MPPRKELQTTKRKRAATEKRKAKHQKTLAKRQFARQATKTALNTMAEEAFGEEGLTPQVIDTLSRVVLGPEAVGQLTITKPGQLRVFLARAKRKFTSLAENYVNLHHQSVVGAYSAGEYDTAARHAEWALEALGDKEERVIEPAPKQVQAAPQMAPIMVGVNLGGVPRDPQ